MRKLLSIILAVVMLASMMAVAIPASAEVVGKYDTFTAQYESGATELYIEDADDFVAFHGVMTADTTAAETHFVGKTIYLANDIDLNPDWAGPNGNTVTKDGVVKELTPAAGLCYFGGTFDGQGHVLSGIYLDAKANYAGSIFGTALSGATVKNLIVDQSYIGSTMAAQGALFAYTSKNATDITVENVYVDALIESRVTSGKPYVGGIFGASNNATTTIKNTVFAGNIVSTYTGEQYVGGILGLNNQTGTVTLENCGFFGNITLPDTDANSLSKAQVGKLVGRFHGNNTKAPVTLNLINCIAGGTGSYTDYRLSSGALIGTKVYVNATAIHFNITNTIWLDMESMNPFTQLYSRKTDPALPDDGSDGDIANDNNTVFTNSCGVDKIALTGTVPANTVYTVGKAVPGNNWETPAEGATNVGSRTYTASGAWDLTSTWTETPVGPMPTALLGMGEGTQLENGLGYLGYQVKAVEGGYAIRFIGEGAFDDAIDSVGLRVGVEGGNLDGLISKKSSTTKVYKGLIVGAEGGEDDYVAADGNFVYTINVGTFTADMGVITVYVTVFGDAGEGEIACQVKTITIDTSKLAELAG